MKLDPEGELNSYEFYPALIRSKARLTYEQVQKDEVPKKLKNSINLLWDVYRLLLKQRKKKGYVSFVQHAASFELTSQEDIKNVRRLPSLETHHLIEEMMLAANKCAADFIYKHTSQGVYRIHEEPLPEKVSSLNELFQPLGLKLKPPYTIDKIASLSKALQGQYPRLASMISRVMQRAMYSIDPDRHYGLNFDLYTHFTSPIRRYPDLIVHRMIYGILNKNIINALAFK
jgi:ribonuclease R